jgi:hypothetical protein
MRRKLAAYAVNALVGAAGAYRRVRDRLRPF